MHISFFPPLGTHTRVPVNSPFVDSKGDQDGVQAVLTARLSSQDYAEAMQTGMRVEVWTNAPCRARPAGEWGPIAFDEVEEEATTLYGKQSEPSLSLNADEHIKPMSPVETRASLTHVLRATLILPRNLGWAFAFTYRLVSPSGICWLGSDRDNGVLELVSESAFFEETGSWETTDGERRFVEVTGSKETADEGNCFVAGKLDVTEWSWSGWATDGLRVWSFSDSCLEPVEDARLAFLIPAALDDSVLSSRTFVLHATLEDTRFAISSQGHVVLRSRRPEATIAYRVHAANSDDDFGLLRQEVLSSCSAPYLLPTKGTDVLLFTPMCDSDTSMTIHAQPLTRSSSPLRSIALPITALDAFAKQSTSLSFCIPETRSILFIDRSEQSENVWLKCGPSGAQVTVSAVYSLTSSSNSHKIWQFALPECNVVPESIVPFGATNNPLPTPPASPQTRPQRTVSFALPSESDQDGKIRHRRPSRPATAPIETDTVVRRLMDPNSAFERYQAASGSEKIKVVIINVLKLLARFMGVAVLRFILFAFRLIGGRTFESPRAQISDTGEDSTSTSGASSPSFQDSSKSEVETKGEIPSGDCGAASLSSSVERCEVESPHVDSRSAFSTESSEESGLDGKQERSISQASAFRTMLPSLKWNLPPGGDAPIRLLVRSDISPDETFEHLSIELNGEDVGKTSSLHAAGEKTRMIEFTRPEGISSVLLVKLTN